MNVSHKIFSAGLVALFGVAFLQPLSASAWLQYIDLLPTSNINTVTAQAYVVTDAQSGEIIASRNADVPWRPASLTKLVTALVLLDENPKLTGSVVMQKNDEVGGARLATKVGVAYKVVDLMNAMLIASANNAATALSHSTKLSQRDFIAAMNRKAWELGAMHTIFVDASGMSVDNYTTARDYAKIAQAAFRQPVVSAISQKQSYSFVSTNNKKYKHTVKTTDQLLKDASLIVQGGKTGYLDESQYNFTAHLRDGFGKDVIVVVFGSKDQQTEFAETKQLALWAWRNHAWPQVAGVTTGN